MALALGAWALFPAAARAGWSNFDRVDPAELDARANVSMVYAEQNLKAPASMFGHTFLVFHDRMPPEPDAPVLEFLGDTSPALAQARAVLLSLPGRFHLSRFVFMRREYDLEDRDLFVYRLRLSADEKARLIAQARDGLRNSWRYNFIGDNCSFQLLALVLRSYDGAPSYRDFPFVLPSDTIAFLRRTGRVEVPFAIASSLRELEYGYGRLSPPQRARFEALASGARAAVDPDVAPVVQAFVRYRAPREPDAARRNALYETAASAAAAGVAGAPAQPPLRDPARMNPSLLGVGWRAFDGGVATATVVPAVRSFEHAAGDGFRNSTLEIGRTTLFFRPGRFGLSELRLVHLDAQQPGSRFADGFTRYLDASFDKAPNRDWSLHDEYRLAFGAGTSVESGALSASAVLFTGPRYVAFEGAHEFLWDVGLKATLGAWVGAALHLRSELRWIPFAPTDHRGVWSNLGAFRMGRVSLAGGVESPAGNPLTFRGVGNVNFAF